MSDIPQDKKDQSKLLFNIMDTDNDSCVNVSQVIDMCKSLGVIVDKDDYEKFEEVHSEGKINYEQFIEFYKNQYNRKINKQAFLNAFISIDDSKSGKIPTDKLKHALVSLGEALSEKEANEFLNKFNKGGKIDYKELVNEMTK